jgi:hypothetical protein
MDTPRIGTAPVLPPQRTADSPEQIRPQMLLLPPVALIAGWFAAMFATYLGGPTRGGVQEFEIIRLDGSNTPWGVVLALLLQSALAFALTVTVIESPVITLLDRPVRWLTITFSCAAISWGVTWFLLSPSLSIPFGPFFPATPTGAEGGIAGTLPGAIATGFIIGISPGTVIAVPQWLLLRKRISRAWIWPLVTAASAAVFTAWIVAARYLNSSA